jgi:hypothetical protein
MWSEPLNYAQMEFLPVMAPLPEEMPPTVDCNVFARRVRKRMAEGLGIPCTEHSYEDVRACAYTNAASQRLDSSPLFTVFALLAPIVRLCCKMLR